MRFYPLLIFLCASTAMAGTNRFTIGLVTKPPATRPSPSHLQWHPSGREVTYVRSATAGGKTTNLLCAFDVQTQRETVVFDAATTTNKVALVTYQWAPGGEAVLFGGENDLWLLMRATMQLRRLTHTRPTEEWPLFSPDGRWIAFVQENDLYIVSVRSGAQRRLTTDGHATRLNGKLDWVYGEEFSHVTGTHRAFEWSPDSRRLIFLTLEEERVPQYPLTDFLRPHPTVTWQRYPKAGDTNPLPRVRLVEISGAQSSLRSMPLPAEAEYVVPEFAWTPDGKSVAVMTLNRAQNLLKVWRWTPGGWSKPRLLLEEQQPCWINIFEPPRFLKSQPGFVWASEKDGWYHLYLHDFEGRLLRPLTHGEWQVEPELSQNWSRRPFEIDGREEWIYFSATTPENARGRQLARVRVDGSRFERICAEAGTHFQKLAPDGRHLLTQSSSVSETTRIRLLRSDGSDAALLDQQENPWRDYATASTEFHPIKADDGTLLQGMLIKPAQFDPARRYPVLVYVYGGPHVQMVRDQWGLISARHHLFAQEGYLIWSLDNRGSWGRGHAWETAVYRQLGRRELADQLAGVRWLRTLPFVETNRFGIWGWSYGGYLTLYALTHAPDVFKCGIAGAPVTDWRFYDTLYTERYMNTPQANAEGYKASSPLVEAAQLKSQLLLIHGTSDDNVHLQNSLNFVSALIKAGRAHQLQIQPGQMHGFGGEAANKYLTTAMVEFLRKNL